MYQNYQSLTNRNASKEEPISMQPRFYSGVYFETDFAFSEAWRPDDNISDVFLKLTFLYRAFHSCGQHLWTFIAIEESSQKKVQLLQNWSGTPTWPPYHCFSPCKNALILYFILNRCANIQSGKMYFKIMLKINWSLKVLLHRLRLISDGSWALRNRGSRSRPPESLQNWQSLVIPAI